MTETLPHHIAYIALDHESRRRGGSTRIGQCTCGWIGPERSTLELAVDDVLQHERSEFAVVQQPDPVTSWEFYDARTCIVVRDGFATKEEAYSWRRSLDRDNDGLTLAGDPFFWDLRAT